MKKYFSYTLVELIVVVAVIWILFTIGISNLSKNSEDRYYAEVCVNTIHWGISNYLYAASTRKILTGTSAPNLYHITKSQQGSGQINLWYTMDNGTTGLFKTYDLNDENLKCRKGIKYLVTFDTGDLVVDIVAGALSEWQQGGMSIQSSGNNLISTGAMIMKYCSPAWREWNECQDFARILFDKRTGLIIKSFCKQYTGDANTKCFERSTGERDDEG